MFPYKGNEKRTQLLLCEQCGYLNTLKICHGLWQSLIFLTQDQIFPVLASSFSSSLFVSVGQCSEFSLTQQNSWIPVGSVTHLWKKLQLFQQTDDSLNPCLGEQLSNHSLVAVSQEMAECQLQPTGYQICCFTLKYGPMSLQIFTLHHPFSR